MKISWKIGIVISLVAIISMASIGVVYANNGNITPDCNSQSLCKFSWVESNDNKTTSNHDGYNPIDPGDNGTDPKTAQAPGVLCTRASGNIASTSATYTACTITINLSNAYPGYHPTIFFGLSNQNSTTGLVSSITFNNVPSYVTMTLNGISKNQVIESGKEMVGVLDTAISIDVPQTMMGKTYNMSVTIVVTQCAQTQNKTQTILGSFPNPSDNGQIVTFGAAVISTGLKSIPTGAVNFMEGTTLLGTSTLNKLGLASFTTSKLSVGSHNITAVYSGDSDFVGSISNLVVQKVRAKTTISWPSRPNPGTFGKPCSFTARIEVQSPGVGTPTGTLTFCDGTKTLGTVNLSTDGRATFSISSLSRGTHSITAVYGGDDNCNNSSNTMSQVIN